MIADELVIAAHAPCPGLTLVTNNIPEFGRVRNVSVENWTRSAHNARRVMIDTGLVQPGWCGGSATR